MQVCEYTESDLIDIERFIFGNLWSKNVLQNRAPDRIKRSILKQEYDKGGLKVTDIKDLNCALKLKEFLRASEANHVIKAIQRCEIESLDYDYEIQQEYAKLCSIDNVTRVGQATINIITDKMRAEVSPDDSPQFVKDLIASTNIKEYLTRKNKHLASSFFFPLSISGIETFKQLHNE